MKKKSQIKKYNVEKIFELSKIEAIPEMLTAYAEVVQQRKKKLQAKKNDLLKELTFVRTDSQKIVYQMVDGVKDRLQKTEKIVMNSESKPTKQDAKSLSSLFNYMQNQSNLIKRNSHQAHSLYQLITQFETQISHSPADFTQLDSEFKNLQNQCEKQQIVKQNLTNQRDSNRKFYETIRQTIQEYRIKYDKIQDEIAQRQRQLDRLSSYLRTRELQDNQKIQYQNSITTDLENRLLKAQQILNNNSLKGRDLQIKECELTERKSQGT